MLHYYLKKIQYFFFKKNFGFSQTNIDSYFSKKKHTVISFSSIHHKISTIQLNEFFYLTKKFNMIFVKDTSRSWFNNLDIQLIKKILILMLITASVIAWVPSMQLCFQILQR